MKSIFLTLMRGKATRRLYIFSVLSFAFSMFVVLSSIGLMDGFREMLFQGLKKSSGDYSFYGKGFIEDYAIEKMFQNEVELSPISLAVQTEVFGISNGISKGILLRGIDNKSFNKISKMKIDSLGNGKIAIGAELAKYLDLQIGDQLALLLGQGNEQGKYLPQTITVEIVQIIKHGIYERDLRMAYMDRQDIAQYLNLTGRSNLVFANVNEKKIKDEEKYLELLKEKFGEKFSVQPYWAEFGTLLEAVEIEKKTILLILQLIVIVAIFNLTSFILFLSESKAPDIFLLRAIGLSLKSFKNFWLIFLLITWVISLVIAFFFTQLLSILMNHFSIIPIPGEIYVLSKFELILDPISYLQVGIGALVWMLLLALILFRKLNKMNILRGLREEFS